MQNDNPVIAVWVNHPNDQHRNQVYSAYLDDMYLREDPFVGVNSQGVIYAQTPCWSPLAMPVPDIHSDEAEERRRIERRHRRLFN